MSLDELAMLRTEPREMGARDRHAIAVLLDRERQAGTLLLATCHRVELSGARASIETARRDPRVAAMEVVEGEGVARHLLRVAVGLDSAVVGEDQVLHQLRVAVGAARARGPMPPALDRVADTALRSGRRARSWLPAARPSLSDVALDRVHARVRAEPGAGVVGTRAAGPVLVVGAGAMGALAARAVRARGYPLLVASRTPERAAHLAEAWHGRPVPLDPGVAAAELEGIVVALSGPWAISATSAHFIADRVPWVVDLSAPSACDAGLVKALGPRHLSIDDLVSVDSEQPRDPLRERFEELVDDGLAELRAWAAAGADREAARTLTRHASDARVTELAALWREASSLAPEERAAIERMTERLTRRLLSAPMERLGRDRDGRYQRAARDLFGL